MASEGFKPVKRDWRDITTQNRPMWGADYVIIVAGERPRFGHSPFIGHSPIDKIHEFHEHDYLPKLIIEVGQWNATITLITPDERQLPLDEDFDPTKHFIDRTVEKLEITKNPQIIKSTGRSFCPEGGSPQWSVEVGFVVGISDIGGTELEAILLELDKEVYAYLPPAKQEILRSCLAQMGVDIAPIGQDTPAPGTPIHALEK